MRPPSSQLRKDESMALTLKPGIRLHSAVCTTELITLKAPDVGVELTIGGVAPVEDADGQEGRSVVEGHGGGALIGKRYVDDDDTIELLCTKGGDGVPALSGQLMALKEAKPLPASD